jgi:hypothetical protein
VQLLLAQHPAVATSPETHVFTQYLTHLRQRWEYELSETAQGYKVSGLTRVLTEEQFYSVCRAFVDRLFDIVCGEPRAGLEAIVEKSPSHACFGEFILSVYPEAYFVHVLRDPRGMVSSYRQAGRTWWREAPTGPIEAAQRWRDEVALGRSIGQRTSRYTEVRYEDLLERGAKELYRLIEWLGLDVDAEFCERAIEACRIERLQAASGDSAGRTGLTAEPAGFFRKGAADAWKEELSAGDIAIVEHIVWDQMDRLGYEPATGTRSVRKPGRLVLHRLAERVHSGVNRVAGSFDWRLRALMKKL